MKDWKKLIDGSEYIVGWENADSVTENDPMLEENISENLRILTTKDTIHNYIIIDYIPKGISIEDPLPWEGAIPAVFIRFKK